MNGLNKKALKEDRKKWEEEDEIEEIVREWKRILRRRIPRFLLRSLVIILVFLLWAFILDLKSFDGFFLTPLVGSFAIGIFIGLAALPERFPMASNVDLEEFFKKRRKKITPEQVLLLVIASELKRLRLSGIVIEIVVPVILIIILSLVLTQEIAWKVLICTFIFMLGVVVGRTKLLGKIIELYLL